MMAAHPLTPHQSVQKLHSPIGIRREHIADLDAFFYLCPRYDKTSRHEYELKEHFDNSTVFTVTGENFGDNAAREFRDQSGLPMFECYRTWKGRRICLPGNKKEELVESKTKWTGGWQIIFRNAAATDPTQESEKTVVDVNMGIKPGWHEFSATVNGQKVVDIRENLRMNKSISTLANSKTWLNKRPRPVLDILVAEGFDTSLVSLYFQKFSAFVPGQAKTSQALLIAVVMSDMHFDSAASSCTK